MKMTCVANAVCFGRGMRRSGWLCKYEAGFFFFGVREAGVMCE